MGHLTVEACAACDGRGCPTCQPERFGLQRKVRDGDGDPFTSLKDKSKCALAMFLDGDRDALKAYLDGDRSSPAVAAYFERCGVRLPRPERTAGHCREATLSKVAARSESEAA